MIFAGSRSFLLMSAATEVDLVGVRGRDFTTRETPFTAAAVALVTVDDIGASASGRGFSSHVVVFADSNVIR